jgi:hypothetical protein
MNKKVIALLTALLVAVIGFIIFVVAPNSDAHDAPPQGSAVCQTTGANATWKVDNGSATTENTGGVDVVVTITSTAGVVAQSNGAVKGDGKVITFTVTDIPVDVSSVTVNAKTTWYKNGEDNHHVTINKPANNCAGVVDIPSAPLPNPPTCDAPGSVVIPENVLPLKWTAGPGVNDVTVHIAGGSNVTFSDGSTHQTFTEDVLPQKTGKECDTSTPTPTPTSSTPAPPTSSTAVPPTSSAPVTSASISKTPVKSSASSSIGTGVAVSRAAVHQPLASTGSRTGALLAVSAALLMSGLVLLFFTARTGKRT